MGKSENAIAYIGLKILLSDIVSQINKTNVPLIQEMLQSGFIDDSNEHFHEVYMDILECVKWDRDEILKAYLTHAFKNTGSYYTCRFTDKTLSDKTLSNEEDGVLWDRYLLVPVKEILSTTRYGYDRYGTNATSRPLDFDFEISTNKYKDILNADIVFILEQNSG
jgi:hypothetical protein